MKKKIIDYAITLVLWMALITVGFGGGFILAYTIDSWVTRHSTPYYPPEQQETQQPKEAST